MKIIIIGSKGFIGTHCQHYFEALNHQVYGCDVVTDYVAKRYFQIDATNSDYRNVFEHTSFDVCINCSGAASVPASLQDPLRDYTLNTLNVFKLLDTIRRLQPQIRFINLSSAAVYGNPEYLPIDETHPCRPISPYGHHKVSAEGICKEFSLFWGLQTCSVRVFSAYGPGLFKQLFWDLAQKAQSANAVELFGTGEETRDFVYVSDLVAALNIIAEKGSFCGEVYNLASGTETRIADAVSIFYDLYRPSLSYRFIGSNRSGDPLNWRADITKLSSLGFKPSLDLHTGLNNYVQWLNEKK